MLWKRVLGARCIARAAAVEAPPKRRIKATDPSGQPASKAYKEPLRGFPEPFGATLDQRTVSVTCFATGPALTNLILASCALTMLLLELQGATNFALFSSNATGVVLCLFTEDDLIAGRVTHQISLDPEVNRTGNVWHIALTDLDPALFYGYMVDGATSTGHPSTAGQEFDMVSFSNTSLAHLHLFSA